MKKEMIGRKAKVEIWDSKKKKSEWHDCKIIKIVNAIDRDYRVDVELVGGIRYYNCAPECVVIQK